MTRAGHVRERQDRSQRLLRVAGSGDLKESGVGERDAHRLALAAVDAVVAESTPVDAVRGPTREADRARAI